MHNAPFRSTTPRIVRPQGDGTRPPSTAGAVALALLLTAALAGCGQKGPLYVPNTPAAAQRATLPETIFGGDRTPADTPTDKPQRQQETLDVTGSGEDPGIPPETDFDSEP